MRQRSPAQLGLFEPPPAQINLPMMERLKAIDLLKALLAEAMSSGGAKGGADSRREGNHDKDHG